MSIENFELVGSYNNQRFPNIDAERTINMFQYIDARGKKPDCLISTSGLQDTGLEFPFSSPTSGFRAEFVLNQFEYFVVGTNFYRRDQFNNIAILNNPLTQQLAILDYIGIDANNAETGEQILIVDGDKGHIWDTGTGIFTYDVKTVDPAFPETPIDVCFLDGFLVVANGGTNTFQLSALNNAYSWGLVQNPVTFDFTTNHVLVSTQIPTGTAIQFETPTPPGTGVLPTISTLPALAVATTYYAINDDVPLGQRRIRLARTYAQAIMGVPDITLTNNGTTPLVTITNAGIVPTGTQVFAPGQLQLGAINSHPGDIVACRTLHRRLFLFSANFTEVWENAGAGTNLSFRRNNALLMEYGTPAIGSIVTGFDLMIFLAQDRDGLGAVMEVRGTESIPISTRALDFQLAQYAQQEQIADARGIFIKENGIIFYRLNFTEANHTFVYDVTLSNPQTDEGKLWHEEETIHADRHPAQTHGYFNGSNFYGSYNSPVLYQVDQAFVTNSGEAIPRKRIGRCYVPATYNRIRIDRFMVDFIQGQTIITNLDNILTLLAETGDTIQTENGLDILLDTSNSSPVYSDEEPPVFLSYSKDGGVTFGYLQIAYLGAVGYRTKRTVWRKLGVLPRGQGFIPKIEFYSQVPFTILGAAWVYEVLPE